MERGTLELASAQSGKIRAVLDTNVNRMNSFRAFLDRVVYCELRCTKGAMSRSTKVGQGRQRRDERRGRSSELRPGRPEQRCDGPSDDAIDQATRDRTYRQPDKPSGRPRPIEWLGDQLNDCAIHPGDKTTERVDNPQILSSGCFDILSPTTFCFAYLLGYREPALYRCVNSATSRSTPPPPNVSFRKSPVFETSSRTYLLKYGVPCHPADVIVRWYFAIHSKEKCEDIVFRASSLVSSSHEMFVEENLLGFEGGYRRIGPISTVEGLAKA